MLTFGLNVGSKMDFFLILDDTSQGCELNDQSSYLVWMGRFTCWTTFLLISLRFLVLDGLIIH